jgi:exodeoxyribonuclease VII large subunit
MHPQPDRNEVLTPTTLNRLVRQLLDDTLPPVWIEGELSNVAHPSSGHVYFTLKDAGAQVRCAMFRPRAQTLRFRPADGLHVRLHGRVGLYEPRGDYQLIADHMEEAGEGALQRAYELLKRALSAEGLFATERKRPLPRFPHRLGVITSPSGAAVRDVLTVIARRFPMLPVDILPSPVQGAEAVPILRERLRGAIVSNRYDILLITRGGGSLEDLWAFNDEQLARDIAASPVPVVAAIGHEVDVTLAELAADLRAPTPSAAAEAIAPDGSELSRQLAQQGRRLRLDMRQQLQRLAQKVDHAHLRLRRLDPRRQLVLMRERARMTEQRLQQAHLRLRERLHVRLQAASNALLARNPARLLPALRARTEHLRELLLRGERERRAGRRMHLEEIGRSLNALSPLRTLDRGYAILRNAQTRSTLPDATSVRQSGRIEAQLRDGSVMLDVPDDA